MKWLFLVNNVDLMMEFLGKVAHEAVTKGDSCLLVFNSKMAEYRKRDFFPSNARSLSKMDWLAQNYKQDHFFEHDISWKEFFPTFERKADLINLNYDRSVQIVSQLYAFFDFVFASEKPDVVIGTAPGNIFGNIAYHFCQKYGIAYLGVIGSKFPNKFDVYNTPSTLSLYEKEFAKMNDKGISASEKQFADTFIEDFVSHKKLPPYMDFQFEFSALKGPSRYIKRQLDMLPTFLKYLFLKKSQAIPDYESDSYLRYNLMHPLKVLVKRLRAKAFERYYQNMNNEDAFFLYPLHFHPEASTLVQATYFSDQINTIKNIAFSLPFPYKLYVKEHPIALGTRSADFYKQMNRLPNVVLIKSSENNKELIEKSAGVVTLTSTVGMEAALLGKQVYVLGDVFYEYHPLCTKIKGFEELRKTIQNNLSKKSAVKNLDVVNRRFVLSYFKNTVEGDVSNALKENDLNNYQRIHKSMKKIYEQI